MKTFIYIFGLLALVTFGVSAFELFVREKLLTGASLALFGCFFTIMLIDKIKSYESE